MVQLLIFSFWLHAQATAPSFIAPKPPDTRELPSGAPGQTILYGFELLSNTPQYIGPKGSVASNARNLMSCRNCHMDVGRRPLGNSWIDTHALYPQYRQREGKVQTLSDRINVCLQHNLLGKPLPVDGPEMLAMLSYYRWIGRGRKILDRDPDQRLPKLKMLARPADPVRGKKIFEQRCALCHGADGAGQLRADKTMYDFPPLWGKGSFSLGTSMSRLSLMARFVKQNMPYEVNLGAPKIKDEDAWDVSAYVLSHERPPWEGGKAFPSLDEKPFDYPIGPYADSFSPEQHKLGPFQPIIDFWKTKLGERAASGTSGI